MPCPAAGSGGASLRRRRDAASSAAGASTTVTETVTLYQRDFAEGSYMADRSHTRIVLGESIRFNPNPDADHMPTAAQMAEGGPYDAKAFQLGFFAAIVVTAGHVELDLAGHELSQHPDHSVQQRFYANIEVGPAPFIDGAGPADFTVSPFVPTGPNLLVHNGIIGRSSHHGVHGNDCTRVQFRDLVFRDFEIAAIHINNGTDILVEDVHAQYNRKDVPVLGIYSTARFIRPHVQAVADDAALSDDVRALAQTRLAALETRMAAALAEVRATGATTDALFRNAAGLVDGNCYGIVFHGRGPAVNDFSGTADGRRSAADAYSRNITLRNVVIEGLTVRVDEVVALSEPYDLAHKRGVTTTRAYAMGIQHDPNGGVFQSQPCLGADGAFVPNEVALCQALVSEHGGKGNLSPGVQAWIRGEQTLAETMSAERLQYRCNGDTMFHVNKGLVGVRMDQVRGARIENVTVRGLRNESPPGSETHAGDYERSHPAQVQTGYQGTCVRAVSLSGCQDVVVTGLKISDVVSTEGACIGLDVFNASLRVRLVGAVDVDMDAAGINARGVRGSRVNPGRSLHLTRVSSDSYVVTASPATAGSDDDEDDDAPCEEPSARRVRSALWCAAGMLAGVVLTFATATVLNL